MAKVWVGVDPGAKGAICALCPELDLIEFISAVDPKEIYQHLQHLRDNHQIVRVVVEDVHSLYGMSAKSNFTFGWNVGIPNTLLQALDIPYEKAQPKKWQKAVGVTAKGKEIKEDVAGLCKELYPEVSIHTKRGRLEDGKSDALMIAHSGYLLDSRKE